jgi:hypothetical protein
MEFEHDTQLFELEIEMHYAYLDAVEEERFEVEARSVVVAPYEADAQLVALQLAGVGDGVLAASIRIFVSLTNTREVSHVNTRAARPSCRGRGSKRTNAPHCRRLPQRISRGSHAASSYIATFTSGGIHVTKNSIGFAVPTDVYDIMNGA